MQKPTPIFGTPIHKLRSRANAIHAALTSNLLQSLAVEASSTRRERDIALEAERDFEPTIKNVFFAISVYRKALPFAMMSKLSCGSAAASF